MKELAKRITVALWGIPLLLFLTYMGGYFFCAFVLVVSGMAVWEFYSMYENKGIFANKILGTCLSLLFLMLTFFYPQYWLPGFFAAATLLLLANLQNQKGSPGTNTAFTMTGFVYISLLLSTLLQLRENFADWQPAFVANVSHAGGWLIIILFASIWICDTAAYFGGRAFGKHKLAPSASPNKTVEGGIFGLIFGIVSFWGFANLWLPDLPVKYALTAGLIVGVFGQLGDLVESRFKRDAGVKDTSTLLPGHGGILDRFDSLIFVSPFLWALFKYQLLS